MKYNVGDMIKIRSDLKENMVYGKFMFIEKMDNLLGEAVSIREKFDNYYLVSCSPYKITDEVNNPVAKSRGLK